MAIGKFFKNFFSIEIEEEVEPDFVEREQYMPQDDMAKPTPPAEDKKVHSIKREAPAKLEPAKQDANRTVTPERKKAVVEKKPIREERDTKKPLMPFSLKGRETNQSKVAEIRRDNKKASAHKGDVKEFNAMSNIKGDTKVHLIEPRVFSESQDIADELKRNKATLVNLTRVDNATKKRIIDFLSGTVYALDGDIQKVGQDIFLCSPNDFGVSGEISDQYEQYEE